MTPQQKMTKRMRFIIERASDFDNKGRIVPGRGWFLNFEMNNCIHSGPWFETYDQALSRKYQEEMAMHRAQRREQKNES